MEIQKTPPNERICAFCTKEMGKYVCPKCNIFYCSLKCYQTPRHLQCSEKFYENCIKEEIKARTIDEHSIEDISNIIKRVNEQFSSDFDSDDDSDDFELNLSERIKGVDLNDANSIWDKLTKDEQQEFEAIISSGEIAEYIPDFKPWWEHCGQKKIQEIVVDEINENCPKIVENIKPFHLLTKVKPAPCVKFNMVNIIAAYTFVVRYFNGDHFDYAKEAVYVLTALSKNILLNVNFDSYCMAVESVHQESLQNDWVFASPDTVQTIRGDVQTILKNSHTNNNCYILRALSDIYNLLLSYKDHKLKHDKFSKRFHENVIPPDKVVTKSNIKKCVFKIEYYLSYMQTFTAVPSVEDFMTIE